MIDQKSDTVYLDHETIDFLMEELKSLKESKKKMQHIRAGFMLSILLAFALLIFTVINQITGIDTQAVLNQTIQSSELQGVAQRNVNHFLGSMVPVIRQELANAFIDDMEYHQAIKDEMELFVETAKKDISDQIQPLYVEFIEKQEERLYENFPEFKDNMEVQKCIDHMIIVSEQKLAPIIFKPFQKHIESLVSLYDMMSGFKDEKIKNIPHLDQAVLGITLEVMGRVIREQAEMGGVQ